MQYGDSDNGADLRELRTLLRSAQNDVKRYAAHVIRLEQELERERLSAPLRDRVAVGESDELLGQELRDEELRLVAHEADSVQQSLARLVRDATRDCTVCHSRRNHSSGEATADADATQRVKTVQDVIARQKRQIEALARENAQLRDSLEKRPSHRDLARSQWQIERLQLQIARLRDEQRVDFDFDDDRVPVFDAAPQEALSDRISVDKLLSWLHVETKKVQQPIGPQATRTNRRRFLKEPVECYLVLDALALDGPTVTGSSLVTENEKMKKREQLSRRVGILCSEIVASCCHSVGVYKIAKLPQYVEATYQYAQLVPYLQDFVHRIDDLTVAAAVGTSVATGKARRTEDATDPSVLETLSSRVQDLVFEVRARREQMKPPGDQAFAVVLRCMKTLEAKRIDELGPIIEKLLDTARREKEFWRDVRRLLGLDIAAPRARVLDLIRMLVEQVGLSTSSTPSARPTGSLPNEERLSNSQSQHRRVV